MPKIIKVQDNIVTIEGKFKYKQDSIFKISDNVYGYLFSATKDLASLLIIGNSSNIENKKTIKISNKKFNEVEIYENFFGSIISPFGNLLESQHNSLGKLLGKSNWDNKSPSILDRKKLFKPLETGMLVLDTMIPIGKGQRELIIGDRYTGKTTIAINTIINQSNKNLKTIYVSIGQKRNSIIDIYQTLKKNNAIKNTIIIFASPDSSAEQFFGPKIGMAIAEFFAYNGEDTLIILDDLTKHANVYREIALSIGKNPGREAYPTDIFYQHSQLLERAGSFNKKYKNGSITCIPIVETVKEDVGSVIPSNVISITDGQIFTSSNFFNNNKYPAINIGLSVSRTGSAVQTPILKKISKNLKSEYAKLYDIKKFADMSIDISQDLKNKINDWEGINNILIQYGNKGYTKEQIVVLIELFRMKVMGNIKDKQRFSIAFLNYCKSDKGAKKIIENIMENKYDDSKTLHNDLNAVFIPLIKVASGDNTDIVTFMEYESLIKEEQ